MNSNAAALNIDASLPEGKAQHTGPGLDVDLTGTMQIPESYQALKAAQQQAANGGDHGGIAALEPFGAVNAENALHDALLPDTFAHPQSDSACAVDWDSLFGQRDASVAQDAVSAAMKATGAGAERTSTAHSGHEVCHDMYYLEAMAGNLPAHSLDMLSGADTSYLRFEYLIL